jgi:RNA polymerase sigma factor (sigma-70 family)
VADRFANLALAVHRNIDTAFDRLVATYQNRLYSYALHLVRNPSDAEEVAQDAFVRAFRALTVQYDDAKCRDLELAPWLYRITRNLALNHCHRRAPLREVSLDDHAPRLVAPGSAPPDAESQGRTLETALSSLATVDRDVVLLRFLENMTYAEVAATMGTGEAAVRSRVFRALRKLRAQMAKQGGRNGM